MDGQPKQKPSDMLSDVPRLVLLSGLLLLPLFVILLRYALVARRQATGIQAARSQLEHEIDDRRRAELAARNSEDRAQHALVEVQQILNQSQDLICTVNREGFFLVVSASSRQMLGYRPEEMMGRHWSEFVYPPDAERTQAEVAALRSGSAAREFENRAIHRSGKLVHLSWSSTWIPESGTSYSIARDVTSRVRQDALREGQRQVLQLIAGGSPLRVVLDATCDFVETSYSGKRCSVMTLDDDGHRLYVAAAPRLSAEFMAAVDGFEVGPEAGSCGTAVWRKQFVVVDNIDTDPLWSGLQPLAIRHGIKSCWSMPIIGENDTVLGTFAVYRHETGSPEPHEIEMIEAAAGLASVAMERAKAHDRLLEGKEQLEFARRIAQLGYWEAFLGSGRVVLSEDMLATLGLPSGEDQDFSRLLEFVVEEDRPALTTARDAALRHDVPVDIEIRLKLQGGDLRYVHFRGRTVRRGDRFSVKLAGTVQDITARKLIELENARLYAELEDRVRSRTRELEQSNRELEAFSYSVSHDLRAPLRAISGFSALLGEEFGPSIGRQGQHYVERIIAGTVRMSALIDDLLELGRVSRIELKRQPLDLSALASAVTGRLHERWPERVVDVEIQRELVTWGDLRLLEVVLENLLENAWKFTAGRPVGRIRVGTTEQLGEQAFFVADNGVGFDPQYAANLFGVFQRLHAASAFPGTGVGLATVQRILQRHGGRIWADAQSDRGATFYFTLS